MSGQPPDPALQESVRSDLEYLSKSWRGPVNDASVRRESAVLRRLLIDGGGTLQRHRRQCGFKGEPEVQFVDLAGVIEPPWQDVTLGMAGGVWANGAYMYGAQMRNGAMPDPPDTVLDLRIAPLRVFLATACIIVAGRPFSRLECITYVANKLGGVHYDTSRHRKGDAPFLLLDQHRGALALLNGLDIVHLTVMSIGQQLLRSPGVIELLPDDFVPLELPPVNEGQPSWKLVESVNLPLSLFEVPPDGEGGVEN